MLSTAFMILFGNAIFALHLGNGNSFPRPLKNEEEQIYVEQWINENDINARNKLIEHNLRLVAHIIKKYYALSSDTDDLISIGTIGLIKGVSSYKPDKKVKLTTYCSRCIENEILMHFRSLKKSAGELSLSDAIDSDGEGNGISLIDVLASDDDLFENLSSKEIKHQLIKYIDTVLDNRESEIIKLRYGFYRGEPKTQREVAELCNISRSYVSRIEKKAIEKLRNIVEY